MKKQPSNRYFRFRAPSKPEAFDEEFVYDFDAPYTGMFMLKEDELCLFVMHRVSWWKRIKHKFYSLHLEEMTKSAYETDVMFDLLTVYKPQTRNVLSVTLTDAFLFHKKLEELGA